MTEMGGKRLPCLISSRYCAMRSGAWLNGIRSTTSSQRSTRVGYSARLASKTAVASSALPVTARVAVVKEQNRITLAPRLGNLLTAMPGLASHGKGIRGVGQERHLSHLLEHVSERQEIARIQE